MSVEPLYGYQELRTGTFIKAAEVIETETRIMAGHYLCLIIENESGEEKRIMCPVAELVDARPYVREMLRVADSGSEFFSIHEIAARDRGEPLLFVREDSADDGADNPD
jgi:hypothetical protein